jgi:hypothetical protein
MKRRDFVAASVGTSLLPTLGAANVPAAAMQGPADKPQPQVLELRRCRLRNGPMDARFGEYLKSALIPALNRAGIKPVGAFTVSIGPDTPSIYLLLPHPTAESVVALSGRMAADTEYQQSAKSFRALPATDPPYIRRESSLMLAFEGFPGVETPDAALAVPSRVFELRTYESHNDNASARKVEMFEKAGEIAIFRKVGLTPVFFGRNVIGTGLPSLTYMLVFADMAAREKNWAAFRGHPDWLKLRATPGYTNADIVTNISSVLLRPTDYSQI